MFDKFIRIRVQRPGELTAPLLLLALFLVLPVLAPAAIARAGTVEGVVFSETGPVKAAVVYAYLNNEDLAGGREFRKSEAGERDGQYSLELPPGSYFLVARANLAGKRLFSYHGVNPISVGDDYRWLPFLLVEENPVSCRETPGLSRITGLVTYKGEPLSGGVVSVYPWQDGKFRGMGLLTNTLDEKGRFSFGLEPGSYAVIARKKQDIQGIGPVRQGDMFCYPSTNPITVARGMTCAIDISCYPRDDLDLFLADDSTNPQGRRHESRRQASLHDLKPAEAAQPPLETPASLSGRVTGPDGSPRPGLVVTAYPARGLELFQMHVVRLITGNMAHTDSDGGYRIELKDADNKYYLVARERVGEAPDRSEYYGLYEGTFNHSLTIDRGAERTGVNLLVDRIMPKPRPDHARE